MTTETILFYQLKTNGIGGISKKFLGPGSVLDLMRGPEKYVSKIRFHQNLYYTLAMYTSEDTTRASRPVYQDCIGIDLDDLAPKDFDRWAEYTKIVEELVGVRAVDMSCVLTGHGLQIIIHCSKFDPNVEMLIYKQRFLSLGSRIEEGMESVGLSGKFDGSIWDPKRLFRVPNTLNFKKGEARNCTLVQCGRDVNLNILQILGSEQLAWGHDEPYTTGTGSPGSYPPHDVPAVLEGCSFLKHCKDNPNDVSEPEWYAMLGVLAFLDDTGKLSHDYSSGYTDYSETETEAKHQAALGNSGPRTCANIGSIWSGCPECPWYGKVTTPCSIRSGKREASECDYWLVSEKGVRTPNYEKLLATFSAQHVYKVTSGPEEIFVWNGKKYSSFTKGNVAGWCEEVMQPKPLKKHVEEFLAKIYRNNRVELSFMAAGTYRGLINMQNGVLDVRRMQLLAHSSDRGMLYCLPYEYNGEAQAPSFEKMLSNVACGDSEIVQLLWEYIGYFLSGDVPHRSGISLLLLGNTDNGKSAFINVLKELIGNDNYSSLSMESLRNPQMCAHLEGKLVNLCDETPRNALMDSSKFKAATTGGQIEVKKLWMQPYTIAVHTKFIFSANELPESKDDTDAILKRMRIVPFNRTFRAEDPDFDAGIVDRAIGELAGIMNRGLEAYARVKVRGDFTFPTACKEVSGEYAEIVGVDQAWIKEHVSVDSAAGEIRIMDIWQAYKEDMTSGATPITRMPLFFRKLAKEIKGIKTRRFRVQRDGKDFIMLRGVKLTYSM